MINVAISSFNVAVALDNTLHAIDKPALGQEEIVFNNFEEVYRKIRFCYKFYLSLYLQFGEFF